MPDIEINKEDIKEAEEFLVRYLKDHFPDSDLSKGSALRDLVIKAMASITAVFKKEARDIRNSTSLRTVANLEDNEDFQQAVGNILSNWFVSQKPGRRVRGMAVFHFTESHSGRVPPSIRLVKEPGISFRLDSTQAIFYEEGDLSPFINDAGNVASYTLRLPVIANGTGTAYEVEEGRFQSVTPFSPFLAYVENEYAYTGATNPESPDELVGRMQDVITKRDLSSNKSIRAVIGDNFGGVNEVFVQGMGTPAMQRDVVEDEYTYYRLHQGGKVDIYVDTPVRYEVTTTASVGEKFTDSRRHITLFKDSNIDDWRTLVKKGDVLSIKNTSPSEPSTYIISEVRRHYVRVDKRQPFPFTGPTPLRDGNTFHSVRVVSDGQIKCINAEFSKKDIGDYIHLNGSNEGNDGYFRIQDVDVEDGVAFVQGDRLVPEDSPYLTISLKRNVVQYSIGTQGPDFDDKIERRDTGKFSRVYQEDGCIVLPNQPVYAIREVKLLDADDTMELFDPVTGDVDFTNRVNNEDELVVGEQLSFHVRTEDPHKVGTSEQFLILDIGIRDDREGKNAVLDWHEDGGVLAINSTEHFFQESDIGSWVYLSNSSTPNNEGDFLIEDVEDSQTVVINSETIPDWHPTPENRIHWSLHRKRKFNGNTVQVLYDTVAQFESIDSYVRSEENDIPAADTLTKAFHPVYLGFDIHYREDDSIPEILNTQTAVNSLVKYINEFPDQKVITVSNIVNHIYEEFGDVVGKIRLPITVYYTLYSPDGRVIKYETDDEVHVSEEYLAYSEPDKRLEDPQTVGVTDQTVRYITDRNLISFTRIED